MYLRARLRRATFPPALALPLALAAVAAVVGCGPSRAPGSTPSVPATENEAETQLELRVVPHVDLYYLVRHRAAQAESAAVEPGLHDAVAAARRIQDYLGSWGGWGPVDTLFLAVGDLASVRPLADALPDPMRLRDGREVALRPAVQDLVAALERLEPTFRAEHARGRQKKLEQAVRTLERDFLPAHRKALAYMLESLAIADPKVRVPVFLVLEANPPAAFTFHLRGGAPASVVSLESGVNTQLFEIVLHESTHALDMASAEEGSVFQSLRGMLETRGVASRDPLLRDVPHTLMFVQAGATVRRFYDPAHVDYGEATTLYARSEPAASIQREVWGAHLAGKIEREEALGQIVERTIQAAQLEPTVDR